MLVFAALFGGAIGSRTLARGERKGPGSGRADNGALSERWGGTAEEHGDGEGGLQCVCTGL